MEFIQIYLLAKAKPEEVGVGGWQLNGVICIVEIRPSVPYLTMLMIRHAGRGLHDARALLDPADSD